MMKRPKLNSLGYPLRPGEVTCDFFVKRGFCNFGEMCTKHHPEKAAQKAIKEGIAKPLEDDDQDEVEVENIADDSVTSLNSVGLPLNEGAEICSYYANSGGYCATRPKCYLAHPEEIALIRLQNEETKGVRNTKSGPGSSFGSKSWIDLGPKPVAPRSSASTHTPGSEWQEVKPKSKEKSTKKFNSRGFPLREGIEDCQFYIKTKGICKHGRQCRYNHPEWVCEFAQNKPLASDVPVQSTTTLPKPRGSSDDSGSGMRKPDPLATLDKQTKREAVSLKLRAFGLPQNACYYFYVEGDCRNLSTCMFRHDLSLSTSVAELSSQTGAQADKGVIPEIIQQPSPKPTMQPVESPRTAYSFEDEISDLLARVSVDSSYKGVLLDTAKQMGIKKSIVEVSPGILSQALLMNFVPSDQVRSICREVASMRLNA